MKFRLLMMSAIVMFVASLPLRAADAAAGKETYTRKCASCHGADGAGKDAIAKMMKVELRHLGSKEVQAKSDADLHKVIVDGGGKMKPVKDLDAKAVDDVVAFLRTLKQK